MKAPRSQAQFPPLHEGVERYLAYLQLERGASPRTVQSYQADLGQLIEHLSGKGLRQWQEVSLADLTSYIAGMTLRKLTSTSAARKITSLRTLVRFLHNEHLMPEDLSDKISLPKIVRKIPQTMSMPEVDRLLQALPDNTPEGIRDRAIVELIVSCGIRISELTGLRLTDLNQEDKFLRVYGKGSKERLLPIGSMALNNLEKYLMGARPKLVRPKTGSELFISKRGTSISRKTVWLMLKKTAMRAGLPNTIKPHLLRHSFATELLKGGADLRLIQELLGHADISTTQIYTTVAPHHLIKTHKQFHPRSKMTPIPPKVT
jgi:integrase/recombinase XerD